MALPSFARLMGTVALTAGAAIGLAAAASALPAQSDPETDFLECLGDHQDTDGIGVCCVFYGGDYDDRSQECYIDFPTTNAPELQPSSPRIPVLTVPVQPLTVGRA